VTTDERKLNGSMFSTTTKAHE